MKKGLITTWIFILTTAMATVCVYTAQAADRTLAIENYTSATWTVTAQIPVPPTIGVEGESYGTYGYIDSKSATLGGGTGSNPATAKIPITPGGTLESVYARSSQKCCSMKKILSLTQSFTLNITADEIVLTDANGGVIQRCDL